MITELVSRLFDVLMESVPASMSLVAVFDPAGGPAFEKTRGFHGSSGPAAARALLDEAVGTGRPLLADDFRSGAGIAETSRGPLPARVLCYPWKVGGRPGGGIVLGRGPDDRPFGREDLELVSLVMLPAIARMERECPRRSQGRVAGPFLGSSEAAARVNSMVTRLGRTEAPVFISGESGTGKELAARALHRSGPRRDGPFVAVNCGAIPENLLESELFGHARGAFTGAFRDKNGLIEEAVGGTFFLDEIGDLPLPLQAKLLRVVEEKRIRRVGETGTRPVDARFVSATNKDLDYEVGRGSFRRDLYYRLRIVTLDLPPLRERKEDIYELIGHMLGEFGGGAGRPAPCFTPAALDLLAAYDWPGNVRELQNEVQRALVMAGESRVIGADCLSERINPDGRSGTLPTGDFRQARADFERLYLRQVLARCGWNRTRTAAELGLTRQGLFKLMKRHAIVPAGPGPMARRPGE